METREEIMKRDFSEEFVNKRKMLLKCLITNIIFNYIFYTKT